jgi:hypothetical protein
MVIGLAKKRNDGSYYVGKPGAEKPIYFGVKPNATQKWYDLSAAMEETLAWNCKDNPYFYMDYDGKGFEDEDGKGIIAPLTDDQAEGLCHGCPLLKLCYDFAVANEEEYGIWGGIIFDKKVDGQLDMFINEE